MSNRLKKKADDVDWDLARIMEWFQDFRGALLEAFEENSDRKVIVQQFKRKMTKRGVRNRLFSRTRMQQYYQIALDIAH